MPRSGPDGPNHYSELRRGPAGAEDDSSDGGNAPSPEPPAEVEEVYSFREDNARMAAANAAEQHDKDRAAKAEAVYRESQQCTAKLTEQAATIGAVHTRFDALGENPVDDIIERSTARSGGRLNPNDPYISALRDDAAEGDPVESLRRAALADDAAFLKQYERFEQRIDKAPTADARRSLEQQQDIYAADHLAEVHHRIADGEEIITGSRDTEEALAHSERASEHEDQSKKAQESYRMRTGRDGRADGLSDETLARNEGKAAETSLGQGMSGGDAASDDVADRLAALDSRFGGGSGSDGPSRPNTAGQSY